MADFNNTSAKPTADVGAVACTLNCNASNLAGLAYLLRMLMDDYGNDGDLTVALTALAGIAERAGWDSLDAAATLEKIEAQKKEVCHA
jgi:hypothetical protein